jgi:hypothetical protein
MSTEVLEGENHVASASDFRKLAEAEAYEEPQRIVLPKSGFAMMVRRPRPLAYTLLGVALPQTLAAKIAQAEPDAQVCLTRQEGLALIQREAELLQNCVVSPRLSLNPGLDEVHPNWLPGDDQRFIYRYLRGEVDASGADLDRFPRAAGATVPAGENGGDVLLPPK